MTPNDLNRLREVILWVEAQKKYSARGERNVTRPITKFGTIGITTGTIPAGGSGTITEQYLNPSTGYENTGQTLTVWNYLGKDIAGSKKVICLYVGGCLHVCAVDC